MTGFPLHRLACAPLLAAARLGNAPAVAKPADLGGVWLYDTAKRHNPGGR